MTDPSLRLERPALHLRAAFLEALDDYGRAGEHQKHADYAPAAVDFADYCDLLLENERGNRLLPGRVPVSTFWMVDGAQRIGGIIRVRHRLSPFSENRGGHIGYDVPPSRRRQGNGRRLLELGLVEAARLGLSRVLLTCDDDNLPSARIIERCGGVLQDRRELEGLGVLVRRYWIELSAAPAGPPGSR